MYVFDLGSEKWSDCVRRFESIAETSDGKHPVYIKVGDEGDNGGDWLYISGQPITQEIIDEYWIEYMKDNKL